MPLRLLRFATILLVALIAGLAFAHVLERPAKMQFESALYITIQKSLYVHWGPPHVGDGGDVRHLAAQLGNGPKAH